MLFEPLCKILSTNNVWQISENFENDPSARAAQILNDVEGENTGKSPATEKDLALRALVLKNNYHAAIREAQILAAQNREQERTDAI